RRGDDDRALAAGVGGRVDVGLVDERPLGGGDVLEPAEGDVDDVQAHVGGGHERRQELVVVGRATPLGDLQRDQVDPGGDPVDAGAVEGGGEAAADPGP